MLGVVVEAYTIGTFERALYMYGEGLEGYGPCSGRWDLFKFMFGTDIMGQRVYSHAVLFYV